MRKIEGGRGQGRGKRGEGEGGEGTEQVTRPYLRRYVLRARAQKKKGRTEGYRYGSIPSGKHRIQTQTSAAVEDPPCRPQSNT